MMFKFIAFTCVNQIGIDSSSASLYNPYMSANMVALLLKLFQKHDTSGLIIADVCGDRPIRVRHRGSLHGPP